MFRIWRGLSATLLVVPLILVAAPLGQATAATAPGIISTAAGGSPTNGLAPLVGQQPQGVFVRGNDVYVNDGRYCAVRHINRLTNYETTIAQGESRYGTACPQAIGIDLAARPYFASASALMRREPDGQQVRIAGTGRAPTSVPADGRPATEVDIGTPLTATQGPTGTVYFAFQVPGEQAGTGWPTVIGAIDVAGRYSTLVRPDGSTATGPGFPGGFGSGILSLAATSDGRLHIAVGDRVLGIPHYSSYLAVFGTDGRLTLESGSCDPGRPEPVHISLTCIGRISTLSADRDGLLVGDGSSVRRIGADGVISTVAGSTQRHPDDHPYGLATQADLGSALFPAADGTGGFYIGDYWNQRLDYVTPAGIIAPVAGDGTTGGNGDGGPATRAQMWAPVGLAADRRGNLYAADRLANRVRVISPDGLIRTFAGTGEGVDHAGDGGPAVAARVFGPHRVAAGDDGSVYIASGRVSYGDDPVHYTHSRNPPEFVVRKVDPTGRITTIAGGGQLNLNSPEGAPATDLDLSLVDALAVDPSGNVYIESQNAMYPYPAGILRIDPAGRWHRFAGFNTNGPTADGTPASATSFPRPQGMTSDGKGGLLVVGGQQVRHIRPDGTVHTVAGRLYSSDYTRPSPIGDGGRAVDAILEAPTSVALDANGYLYISEANGFRVRRVTTDGRISTIAGTGSDTGPLVEGVPATSASLRTPASVAVVGDRLYIGVAGFHGALRMVTLPPVAPPPPPPNPIVQRYQQLGGATALGTPVGAEQAVAGGRVQAYTLGSIYWSPATGAKVVKGQILSRYEALGGPGGKLGFPTTDELTTPDGRGRYNHFTAPGAGGSIYWTASTGAHSVMGAIRTKWSATSWERGPLGYPTTDEMTTPDRIGRYNHFTGSGGASIYWTSAQGAHAVYGAIRAKWASLGWERGRLSYPYTDEYAVTGGRRNDFLRGSITWRPSGTSVVYR